MIHAQNLAYCRYIHIWCFAFLLNIVQTSPLSALYIISPFHLYSLEYNSKRIGIVLQDLILIYFTLKKNNQLYLFENFIAFLIYIKTLHIIDISPIKLYTKYLKIDDNIYRKENYIEYLYRIWTQFILN